MTLEYGSVAAGGEFLCERIERDHAAASTEEQEPRTSAVYEVSDLGPYLSFDEWPTGESYPTWVTTLADVCESLEAVAPDDHTTERPFGGIVQSFLPWATGTVLSTPDAPVTDEALDDLREDLRERLGELLAQPLHIDYRSFVDAGDGETQVSPESTRQRTAYAAAFCDGRCESFFESFPLLGRLLIDTVRQWRSVTDRLLDRLSADRDAVAALVSSDDPFPVVGLAPGAGDAHDGGETVVEVSLARGRVVYKPRSVATERSLSTFYHRLSETTGVQPPSLPSTVDRSDYGWVEFVEPDSFDTVEAVTDYYRHAGVVAWLATLLGTTDLHGENVLATREGPVVIDAETAVSPPPPDTTGQITEPAVRGTVAGETVLDRALVPFYTPEDGADWSGYGATHPDESDRLIPNWSNPGTDAVGMQYEFETITPQGNHPRLDGDPAPLWLFDDELLSGFERAQRAVARRAEAVRQAAVEAFRGTEVRVIPRQSMLYRLLLDTLSNPQYLRDGGAHELKLTTELLARWDDCEFEPRSVSQGRVVRAERDVMLRRDIPRFTVSADDTSLRLGSTCVATDVYRASPLDALSERVYRTATGDLEHQRRLLYAVTGGESLPRPSDTVGGDQQ